MTRLEARPVDDAEAMQDQRDRRWAEWIDRNQEKDRKAWRRVWLALTVGVVFAALIQVWLWRS